MTGSTAIFIVRSHDGELFYRRSTYFNLSDRHDSTMAVNKVHAT